MKAYSKDFRLQVVEHTHSITETAEVLNSSRNTVLLVKGQCNAIT